MKLTLGSVRGAARKGGPYRDLLGLFGSPSAPPATLRNAVATIVTVRPAPDPADPFATPEPAKLPVAETVAQAAEKVDEQLRARHPRGLVVLHDPQGKAFTIPVQQVASIDEE